MRTGWPCGRRHSSASGLWRCKRGRAIELAGAWRVAPSGLSRRWRFFSGTVDTCRRAARPSYVPDPAGCSARRRPADSGLHARALALHTSALLQRAGSGVADMLDGSHFGKASEPRRPSSFNLNFEAREYLVAPSEYFACTICLMSLLRLAVAAARRRPELLV